jgi:maltose O-acetyltransferase
MKGLKRLVRYDWPLHFVLLLTNWLPDNVIFLRLRGWLARPFLGRCGYNLRLGRNVTFYNPSAISLGRDVYVAQGTWFMAGETITVADEVLFGPYCVIVSSNHSRVNGSFRFGPAQREPISIGRGCWFGAHVTVAAGSTVGDGVLVAANSVVTGEIPADHLAAGLPARVIRPLDDAA